MLYNARPAKNKTYVPYIRDILDRMECNERLAISPQNNLIMEEKMSEKSGSVAGAKAVAEKIIDRIDERSVQGNVKVFEEVGKEDSREIYAEEERSSTKLDYPVGVCPQCEGNLICKSTRKAFGKAHQAWECSECGYVDNR